MTLPDLELCFNLLLSKQNDYAIYLHHLPYVFGMQRGIEEIDPLKLDQGQFHYTGYTKRVLRDLLKSFGFKIHELFNFDGTGTPSISVIAEK